MVLIYIFPMTNDVEHLFMYLLAICVSLEKCLFKFFAHFWVELLFFCCSDVGVLYIFWILVLICKYFLPLCGLCFHPLGILISCTKVFYFDEVNIFFQYIFSVYFFQYIYIFLLLPLLLMFNPRSHCQTQYYKDFSLCFLLRVLQL